MDPELVSAAQALLPVSGEMTFDDWKNAAMSTGQSKLVKQFHRLRRAGYIAARVDNGGALFVSRSQPEGGA